MLSPPELALQRLVATGNPRCLERALADARGSARKLAEILAT